MEVWKHLFESWLAARPETNLDELHVEDAYLAAAVLAKDVQAQKVLARDHLSKVPSYVARLDPSSAFGDEVTQEVARRLLVAEPPTEPALARYTGAHPLGAFIRVIAMRAAQDLQRKKNARADAARPVAIEDGQMSDDDDDPERRLLKARYSKEFANAFAQTLATLETDERNVLRLHYVDGLSLDEVAKAYNISRATAARWIAKAKERIVAETHRALRERLGESVTDPRNLLSLVQSQLDVSVARHLR